MVRVLLERSIVGYFYSNFVNLLTQMSSGCIVKGRITDPRRLYKTTFPPVLKKKIQDSPVISIPENIDTLFRLFSPQGGLSFSELMSQIGCCINCGQCFGVALLRCDDYIKHLCPGNRSPSPKKKEPSPSPNFVQAQIRGQNVLVEEGLLSPSASSLPGPSRPRSARSNVRYNPIPYKDHFSTPPRADCDHNCLGSIDLTVDETP